MVLVTHEHDSVLVETGKQKGLESLSENREWRCTSRLVCLSCADIERCKDSLLIFFRRADWNRGRHADVGNFVPVLRLGVRLLCLRWDVLTVCHGRL